MAKVITRRIINELDSEQFTLYVEWLDSAFKIMLIKVNEKPLIGEMEAKDINFFSEELGKSSAEYLQEAEEAFSGKNAEIQFFITCDSFEWKQKNVWTLGRIGLKSVSSIETLADTLQNVLKFYNDIYARVENLEEENKTLKAMRTRLTASIEEMEKIKSSMEQDLYKKFLLILNEKKRKIRELQNLQQEETGKQSVFNVATDDSSQSDQEIQENSVVTKSIQTKKRKGDEFHDQWISANNLHKSQKLDSNTKPLQNAIKEKSPQASTSKDYVSEGNNSFGESNSSPECPALYVTDNESEEDMFD